MKILSKALLAATLLLGSAQADFIRAEMGAGVWATDPSGSLETYGQKFNVENAANIDKESEVYAWAMFKHFLPLIPNVRVEYATMKFDSTTAQSLTFLGANYSANSNFTLDMKQIDLIGYYNLLDNTLWLTLDVGLDLKLLDGYVEVRNTTLGTKKADLGGYIPMAFARTRAELPFGNIAVDAEIKYLGYGDSHYADAQAKLEFTLAEFILGLGLEVGYRIQELKLQNDFRTLTGSDISADQRIEGWFAGLQLKF